MNTSERNLCSAEDKLYNLLFASTSAGIDGAESSLEDRILLSSLCGMESPILSAKEPTLFEESSHGCVALLLACRISNQGLQFRNVASNTISQLRENLDMREGISVAGVA